MKIFSHTPQMSQGFSLIELLVTIGIIGILASIAYPGYQNHVIKANRAEGQAVMLVILSQQQNFFARNMTYTTSLNTDLGYNANPFITNDGHYSIAANTCAAPYITNINGCVNLTATAQGTQVSDGTLTINSAGVKTPAGKW